MPNRIIRESILTSESMASLDWGAEVFYRRLMSIVDDYGRHEAGHQLLRAKCYPLQTDSVRVADIARWMAACQKAGVILVYGASGKQYVEVSKFQQQQRTPSKCPPPPTIDINCSQTLANAHLGVCVSGGVSGGEEAASPAEPAQPPAILIHVNDGSEFPVTHEAVSEFGQLYPAVDVMAELRKMRGWAIANATKRKTRGGMLRFINTWLAKEQDKGHGPQAAPQTPQRKLREL